MGTNRIELGMLAGVSGGLSAEEAIHKGANLLTCGKSGKAIANATGTNPELVDQLGATNAAAGGKQAGQQFQDWCIHQGLIAKKLKGQM